LPWRKLEAITKEGLALNDNIRKKEDELKELKQELKNFQKTGQ
jgi:hypothetical protein